MATTDIVQTAAIIVSVLALFYQLRREWLLHSAEMVTSLVSQYNSEEFENRRKSVAALLEPVAEGKQVSIEDTFVFGVLGFYENLGHLVRRRALDDVMVWNKFAWDFVCYFQCLVLNDNALKRLRDKYGDPTLYEEIEWLNARFVRIYRRRGVSPYRNDGRVRWLNDFFSQERKLGSLTNKEPQSPGLNRTAPLGGTAG